MTVCSFYHNFIRLESILSGFYLKSISEFKIFDPELRRVLFDKVKFTGLGKGGAGLDIWESCSGSVETDNCKGEQCSGCRGALQGWEHFLVEIV